MYTNISNNEGLSDRVAGLLADSWANRVAVKVGELDSRQYYDPAIADYPPDLVPFRSDPRYARLDIESRRKLLAAAWVAYNEKTIDVEVSIVSPACTLLLKGVFQGLDTAELKRVITQTQVDEQYHILMCLDGCLLTRQMHGIKDVRIPQSSVVEALKLALDRQSSPRDAHIVQMAFATVAEVTINSYLSILANAEDIQPFNREITALHRRDEFAHNKIFSTLAGRIYRQFDEHDRSVFKAAIASGLEAFVRIDMGPWRDILSYLQVPEGEAIIDDCIRANPSKRIIRDYSGFRALLQEIGVEENQIDFNFD
jgi:alpha-N-dichloroacetyl-p-aminophenylserinol N-oxygenase